LIPNLIVELISDLFLNGFHLHDPGLDS